MLINPSTTRTFHRRLFAQQMQTITLIKRGDDQQQGTTRTLTLYECRWGIINKQGQTLQGDMVSQHERPLHIPRTELERVGVEYLNPLDRFVDEQGRTWMPESTTPIDVKLFENHVDVQCLRTDPA